MKIQEFLAELSKRHPKVKDVMFLDEKGGLLDVSLDYLHILGQPDYTTIIISKEER